MDAHTWLAVAATFSAIAGICSATALILNTWKQSFKKKRPLISLLNEEGLYQPARVVPFLTFPQSIRDRFPDYSQKEAQNAALLLLMFSNAGDADGFVLIENVKIVDHPNWKASYYSQDIVGAKSYCIHEVIILRMPALSEEKEIDLEVCLNWGGDGKNRKSIKKKIGLKLLLGPNSAGTNFNQNEGKK